MNRAASDCLCSLPQTQAGILFGKLRGEGFVADVDPPALGLVYGQALPPI